MAKLFTVLLQDVFQAMFAIPAFEFPLKQHFGQLLSGKGGEVGGGGETLPPSLYSPFPSPLLSGRAFSSFSGRPIILVGWMGGGGTHLETSGQENK